MKKRDIEINKDAAVKSAIRTVETEKAGLAALGAAFEGALGNSFFEAIAAIGAITGRVILTGVGKSGHIGTKIAATFASTGTPAFFVHPAEANHGDLGMIARDDIILAMSWSGEAAELKGIITYSRRFSIPLIALTSGADSALAREADIVLLMPKEQEACPHGLAPTTSTMMQLALGDALAVALLEARGFTAGDFRTYHPGGKLGATLSHVGDIMHEGDSVPLVPVGTLMPDAASVLSKKRFGCVGVVGEDGTLAGIITDGDIARNLGRNLTSITVEDIMTKAPKTVRANTLATTAMAMLNDHNISALLVIDDEKRPIGVIHFHDLLRIGVA